MHMLKKRRECDDVSYYIKGEIRVCLMKKNEKHLKKFGDVRI